MFATQLNSDASATLDGLNKEQRAAVIRMRYFGRFLIRSK
jgi:hypothetical protein